MFSLTRKPTFKKNARKPVARPTARVVSRPIKHERWIDTDQLEIGMYVAELSVPWEDTRFMFQGFVIDSPRLLKQVKKSAESALIRTEKVAQISSNSANRFCNATRSTSAA